ncbi:MAG: efflux RND transporter periplasmic adaptor subunit [Gemmatimonadaceae bacterium]
MNRKTIVTAAATLSLAIGGGAWFYSRAEAKEAPAYRTAAVQRGSLQQTVSATGALGAVRTVQVGTQVSGQVAAIYVDFNDRVRRGQLLARIDPTLQQQAVADAQAGLDRAIAQYELAKGEYERGKQLFDAKVYTAAEWGSAQSGYAVQQANVKSARVALERARQNLAYTNIHSPIDGVIVERNVDVGQTVAASLSAPQLFLIANDLSQMQILASVDESDIGSIKEGQPAEFSVQSYADQTFKGTVEQVRLQSKTQDNVVNYTAVVRVRNEGGKLLPGMTATVKFLTATADSVLVVPNAALRFTPSAEELKAAGIDPTARGAGAPSDSARAAWRARQGAQGGQAGAPDAQAGQRQAQRAAGAAGTTRPRRTGSVGTLYYMKDGKLAMARVRTGLTDGQNTQVTGRDLTEGMQVIVAAGGATQAAQPAAAANPFQQSQQQGGARRGPPGPF